MAPDQADHSLQQAQQYVKRVLNENGIAFTKIEAIAIETAWEGVGYVTKSNQYDININTLRNYGSRLWRNLSNFLDKDISLATFKVVIRDHISHPENTGIVEDAKELNSESYSISADNNVAFSIPVMGAKASNAAFYGREDEIVTLQRLIGKYSCIIINGVAGIGKRSLVSRFLQVTNDLPFSEVLWKPLHYNPTAFELEDKLSTLSQRGEFRESFIEHLVRHQDIRYLIVLEGMEAAIKKENKGFIDEGYITFIRRIVEETQSKIIMTTTVSLNELKFLVLDEIAYSYTLYGLPFEDARHILDGCFKGDARKIVDELGGNPLLLKRFANWSKAVGAIDPELSQRETIVNTIVLEGCKSIYDNSSVSDEDVDILTTITKETHPKGMLLERLLKSKPKQAIRIMELVEMGLIATDFESDQLWLKVDHMSRKHLLNR